VAEQQGRMAPACPRANYVVGVSTIAGQTGLWYLHAESQNLREMRCNSSAISVGHAQSAVAMHGVPDVDGRLDTGLAGVASNCCGWSNTQSFISQSFF